MDQKFFIQPFAFAGDKTAIPDAVQPSGVVSFNQGYGFDYQRELGVDPDAKSIERNQMNYLFGVITEQLGQYQRESIPEFITTADNGGAPYPYARGVSVRYRASGGDPFLTYVSKVAANTATPTAGTSTANWELQIFERASNAQALAGVDDNTIMTPLRVKQAITASAVTVPAASETVAGIAEIATTAEVNAGTDDTRIITPAKLAAYVPSASTTVIGKTRLATNAEAIAGSLSNVAVTPSGLAAAIAAVGVPPASETTAGIAEIATTAEVTAGTDDARIVTPLKLAQAVPAASTTVIGKTRLATSAETSAMALATVAVTPASLSSLMGTKANLSGATFSGAVVANAGVSFGSTVATTAQDLSEHIALYSTTYGFNVTASNLNYNAGTTTAMFHTFYSFGTESLKFNATGTITYMGNVVYHAGNFNPALKANLAGPAFTGVPTAPTAAVGTNTTQIATTAFVQAYDDAAKANLASPAFTGVPTAPTAAAGTNTTQLATTAYVRANDDPAKANLAGAAFTGAISVVGGITSSTNWFVGSATAAVLASAGAGTVYLRPNGQASATGQTTVASSGNMTVVGSVTANGGFQQGSSRLIKRDLRALPYGLAAILGIETAIGKYVEDMDPTGRDRLFVIAEQLREIVAEPVFDDGVVRDGMTVPSVDYTQLIPVLIEAIKELYGRLVKLEG
jgi:hypothetical protein